MADWTMLGVIATAAGVTVNTGVLWNAFRTYTNAIRSQERTQKVKSDEERQRVEFAALYVLESCSKAYDTINSTWDQLLKRMNAHGNEQQFYSKFYSRIDLLVARDTISFALEERHLAVEVSEIARKTVHILNEILHTMRHSSHETDNSVFIYEDLRKVDDKLNELEEKRRELVKEINQAGSRRRESDIGRLYISERKQQVDDASERPRLESLFTSRRR